MRKCNSIQPVTPYVSNIPFNLCSITKACTSCLSYEPSCDRLKIISTARQTISELDFCWSSCSTLAQNNPFRSTLGHYPWQIMPSTSSLCKNAWVWRQKSRALRLKSCCLVSEFFLSFYFFVWKAFSAGVSEKPWSHANWQEVIWKEPT